MAKAADYIEDVRRYDAGAMELRRFAILCKFNKRRAQSVLLNI